MQSAVECLVCCDTFTENTRLPKILTCGHGVCEPCVRSLLALSRDSEFKCPICRAKCVIPDQQAEKLPTNFPILALLDSLCGDCKDRPHNGRCGHCPLNVCGDCRGTHQGQTTNDLAEGIRDLYQSMADLNDLVSDDNDVQAIQEMEEVAIKELQEHYNEQIQKIEEQIQKEITDIKTDLVCKRENLMDWKEKSRKLFADCNSLLYKHRNEQRTATSDMPLEHENELCKEVQERLEAIELMKLSKPSEACYQKQEHFTIVIRKSTISVSQQTELTQPEEIISVPTVEIPDYAAASYKAMFDKQMSGPTGICFDPTTGHVVTTDYDRNEVFVLSAELQLVRRFGARGQGSNQYNCPWGVAASDGNLYVCDRNNDRVHITDQQGVDLLTFGYLGSGQEQFMYPFGMSCDKSGLLYVCDHDNKRIKVTDNRGKFIREFGNDVFDNSPRYISVSHEEDKVAVTTRTGNNIYLFTTDGQHVRAFNTRNPAHNIDARGVTFDDHGHLLVSDGAGGRVAVITETGDVVSFIGSPGAGPGQLQRPRGLALTQTGDVVVCDMGNHRIQLFKVPKRIMYPID